MPVTVPVVGWSGLAVSDGLAGWVGWAQPPAGRQTKGWELHYLQDTSTRMEGPEKTQDDDTVFVTEDIKKKKKKNPEA